MKKRYIALIFLLVVGVVIYILINTQLDGYIRNKLEKEVRMETDSTYRLSMDGLEVSLFPARISISDLQISSADSTYIFLDSTASILLSVKAGNVLIDDFDWQAYLFSDEIKGSLHITEPDIDLILRNEPGTEFGSKSVNSNKNLLMTEITLNKGHIIYRNNKEKLETNLYATIRDVTNKSAITDLISSLQLNLTNANYTDPSGIYGLSLDSAMYSGGETSLSVSNLEYRTLPGKQEISAIMGYQQSWYDLNIPSLKVTGNGNSFMADSGLHIQKIAFVKPRVTVYSDGRYGREGVPHKDMPDEMINTIPFPIMIEKLSIKEGYISYETHSKKTDDLGQLTFSNLTIEADSFSNRLPEKPFMINASAFLMEKGKVDVEIKVPQSKQTYPYMVKGHISPMNMTEINPIYQPVSNCRIESGQSQDSYFTFSHDDKVSSGNMRFYYEDLKVEIPKDADDGFFKRIGSSLKTALANTFVVNSDSESEEGKTGDISAKRDESQFVLGFWWRSLLSGFMDTMK